MVLDLKIEYSCTCVAVTGRNQTLFYKFLTTFMFVTLSYNLPECSKLAYSNSYICAVSAPTLGLYVQSISLGNRKAN